MTGIYSLRAVDHDTTGDTIVSWAGCIVGVRVSSPDEAHAVGSTRTRVTTCPLTFGAYGGCVRRAQHSGDCADAHGNRYAGRLMSGTAMRWLTTDERMLLGVCVDCAGSGVWDDDTTCETCQGYGEPTVAQQRAACMANHPAGKGRAVRSAGGYVAIPVRIGGGYPANVDTRAIPGTDGIGRANVAALWDMLHTSPWNYVRAENV